MTVSAKRHLGLVVALLLLAFGLRVGGLDRPSILASDELLFADRARRMVLQDDVFLTYAYTDKSPTTYLIIGASLGLVGESDFAVRLPNLYFSLLFFASLYALAKMIFRDKFVALWVILCALLSPLEARYAVSGFQDTPMLTLGVLALWFASRGRWTWSGWWFGWAVIMKPTILGWSPLVLILGASGRPHPASPTSPAPNFASKSFSKHLISTVLAFMMPLLTVYLWDYGRAQHFYELGSANNNPRRFIRADEVWPRLETWLNILGELSGTAWLTLLLGVLGLIALWKSRSLDPAADEIYVRLTPKRSNGESRRDRRHPVRDQSKLILLLLANFAVLYFGVQWLVAFNTYDRYMLILAPFFWLWMGYGMNETARFLQSTRSGAALRQLWPLIIVLTLIGISARPVQQAATEDLSAYSEGIPELVEIIETDYPHTVFYDYWLNLELAWYLSPETNIVVAYFGTPEALAIHLATEDGARYFVAPSPHKAQFWVEVLQAKGNRLTLVYQAETGAFVIYEILPPRSVLAEFFG